jgi:transposase
MGCGTTCWRRFEEWHEAGVQERLHRTLLDYLGQAVEIERRAPFRRPGLLVPGT